MEVSMMIELIGIILGGGGLIGFGVGFATFKWMTLKAKSEAKTAEAEADIRRQDYYQEVIDDMEKDRQRMKAIREEQEAYIAEIKADRKRLHEEKEILRQENGEYRRKIIKLENEQREQGDKIARLGRLYEAMKPLVCSNINCKYRQGDIMGPVDDYSFETSDVKEEKNDDEEDDETESFDRNGGGK